MIMDRVKTLENGEIFTRNGCGTTDYYYEISKEEYERIKAIPNYRGVINSWIEETMSDDIRYGYGFYGCDVLEGKDNKYFYCYTIGNSCE